MKKILIFTGLLCISYLWQTGLSYALERTLIYQSFADKNKTDNAIAETTVKIKDHSDDQKLIHREKQIKNCMINDDFILDKTYSLDRWTRVCAEEKTEFIAQRKGEILEIRGKLNGKIIDKELKLGSKALHIYPKYSLGKFALSDKKKIKFWSMRRDKLTKLPMQAIKKGLGTIVVNGREVQVIKVYYSITGKLREKYFNHNYYYRATDGLFVKKVEPGGRVEQLVNEK